MERFKLRLISAAIILSLIAAVGAAAQPPLTITSAGYFYTEVDSDGIPVMVKITTVIDLTDKNNPAPAPPEDGDVDLDLVENIKAWSSGVEDPQAAQAIAAVYSHIRGAVDDGILDAITVWPALKDATDSAIDIVEGDEKWTGLRKKLSAVVTEKRQRGTLQNEQSIARMIRSVQHGLELSADGSTALPIDELTAIAAKTNEAIDEHK